jgi:hypothetical protein
MQDVMRGLVQGNFAGSQGRVPQAQEQQRQMDAKLLVAFDVFPVLNEELSTKEARPVYDDKDYISIMVPGDQANVIHRPIWVDPMNPNSDSERFSRQYEHWKAHRQNLVTGTPLESVTWLTKSQVKELAYFNCRTVEQLAAMGDGTGQKFMGIVKLQKRAQDFLAAAAGAAPAEALRAELEKRDIELDTLKKALKEQGDVLERLMKAQPQVKK